MFCKMCLFVVLDEQRLAVLVEPWLEFELRSWVRIVLRAVLEQAELDSSAVDEVILGCVLMAGTGQAPARQAALGAGLPNSVQAMTINKVCSSGLKAVMLAHTQVQTGLADCILAGGMESMSNAPYVVPSLRSGARLGHVQAEDVILVDGLWDVYNDFHMGNAAELCADKCDVSREQQDAFAVESYRRANAAIAEGIFAEEISPITVKRGREKVSFDIDEEPGRAKPEKIPNLRPVFKKDGTVTAANASSINDGAAAMLVASEEACKKHNLKPLARIVSQGWHGREPEWFSLAPVEALRCAVRRAGKGIPDIDLFEINEAFSTVSLACMKELEVDSSVVNVNGGAVALGHPIGASGARILGTLIYSLSRLEKQYGAVGICNGGGEATAMVIESV